MAGAVIGSIRVNLGLDGAKLDTGAKNLRRSLGHLGESMRRVSLAIYTGANEPDYQWPFSGFLWKIR